jgi:hypothetical protein
MADLLGTGSPRHLGQYHDCAMSGRYRAAVDRARLERYEREMRRLATQLGTEAGLVRFVASGSLVRRYTFCGKAGCRCQAEPPQPHGPYWQWTKKVAGKTVTRRLSDEGAALFQRWVGDRQRLQAILDAMEEVSDKAAALLVGAPRTARRRSRASR